MVNKSLSIIIPCYNEGEKLYKNIPLIKKKLAQYSIDDYEIIIVNDGSKDNTHVVCTEISSSYVNVVYCHYNLNRGKGGAVKEGVVNSTKDYVIYMDADLSTDLDAINDAMNLTDNCDVVIGSRKHPDSDISKKQPFLRQIIGFACSLITNSILFLNIRDTQCGFKLFEGDLIRKIVNCQVVEGFAFDVEYLYICKLNSICIKEIPISWNNDDDSKVSPLSSSLSFFKDLIVIRKHKKIYMGGI